MIEQAGISYRWMDTGRLAHENGFEIEIVTCQNCLYLVIWQHVMIKVFCRDWKPV